ncbi:ABC transporter ATP-binding protein [Peptoniphilus catoniae]|uniref:ABC transporter ATP-binding protein n=1 Tax=Peptoniphilus catoniae TaxID=1660341 RepID=UPI0010FD0F03|nr:ABC transporter ATP-binding protein [Peptoniphilus catoniae]
MIKKILSYVKEYKKYALASPLFVVIEVFMDILIPYLMSLIIDRGIKLSSQSDVIKIGVLLVLAVLVALATGIASGYFATKASAGFAKNLRLAIYEKIQDFAFEDIEKFSTGSLMTRMSTDVQNVQVAFQMSTRLAIRAPLMIVFAMFMALKIQPDLAVNYVIIFPIIGLGIFYIFSQVSPIFKIIFETIDKLNTQVSENLSAIRVVKSFNKMDHEVDKFNEVSYNLYKYNVRASKLMALANPLMQLCMYLITLIIAWLGTRFILQDTLMTGQLLSMITYAIQIQISLMMLSFVLIQIVISKNSVDRIVEVLNHKPSMDLNLKGIKTVENGEIEFDKVSFSYAHKKDKCVLENINLRIKSGDKVGIIGPTGSGKTSLVNLIPRLYDSFSGEVKVGGINVREYNLKALRDQVAVVLQKNQLFTGSVIENLRWGDKEASLERVREVAKIAQADSFIMENKEAYDTHVERGGTNFSGGQRQRLCIARALLKNPKILILDDSTSALDTQTEGNIIKALNKDRPDMTRIIISQRIKSIKDCDYIIVMDKGEIVDIGSHDELLRISAIYKDINETQREGGDFDEQK